MFTQKQVNAAAHTLWQAAVASGGVGEIAKSVTDHSVNVPGAEQGLIVAGVAVGGAALSLVKSLAVNWYLSHKATGAVKDAVKLDAIVQAVEKAYEAKHVTAPAA